MPKPRVTIAEIAERAGLSVPTISKVLNGRTDVSPETRARVETLLREAGYQRRRSATGGAVPMIDLVFHDLGNAWATELIAGVERAGREAGVAIVLSEIGGAHQPLPSWIESVLARRPMGVIMVYSSLAPEQRAQLDARRIPYVVVDPIDEEDDSVPCVGSANFNGGRLATRHLIELGHRRIAVIGGHPTALTSRARVAGYRDALTAAGIDPDPGLTRHGGFSVEGGYEAVGALLDGDDPPTAIFAGNDLQALGAYRAILERRLRIPEDVSVVGYDDIPLAEWIHPSLTTVHQPLLEMAHQATRLLLALARREPVVSTTMDLAVSLTVRASTAAPGRR